MGITHATVATGTDAGTGEIHKAEWNADHTLTGFLPTTLQTVTQEISADFTTGSGSTWTDVTGLTGISVGAGTWMAYIDIETGAGVTFGPIFRLSDGTNIYAEAAHLLTNPGTTLSNHLSFASKPFTIGSAGTFKIQYYSDTVFAVKKYPSRGGDTSSIATKVTFLLLDGNTVGGLTLLEQHTASSSATLDFTTFISSSYDEYQFEFVSVIPATNDVAFRMQMGTGGGPTWDTGTNYAWQLFTFRAGGSALNGAESGQSFISFTYGAGGTLGIDNTTTSGGMNGSIRLFNPQSTAVYKHMVGQMRYKDAEPFWLINEVAGTYLATTALTGIRFYMSSGNIASGTIRVYGLGK
jgi:hypothetical protein